MAAGLFSQEHRNAPQFYGCIGFDAHPLSLKSVYTIPPLTEIT